ncbi:MAG TPA: hypothetical protein VHD36_09300 [Pirellulales bacterium]|nr:hypothetical protein [Pirellulales bacterium]
MRCDYWNDPLVVSAFRVRFRGGAPTFLAATYFMGLVALGGILHHFLADQQNYSWISIYCVALFSIETVLMGLGAMMATHHSMNAEVTNRTLDFQRIAAVPPRDILLGKLVGEPAQAYLMVLAGLPLLVWCWGMGAVTTGVLVPLIVQLATTAFLMGSIGLIHNYDTSADKTKQAGRMIRNAAIGMFTIYGLQITIAAPFLTTNPLTQIPLGALTPIFGIAGLARGAPTADGLPLFDYQIPYLYLTPITQIAIGAIVLHSLARRMISPVNVALSKPLTYAILAVIDVAAAGVVGDPRAMLHTLDSTVAVFCLIHVSASLLMMLAITPGRECLRSWVWRFRGRQSLPRDLLLGERSENVAALAAFCALGLAAAMFLVILPGAQRLGLTESLATLVSSQADKLAAMCLLMVSLGVFYQWLVSLGPAMAMFFVLTILTIVVGPHLAGVNLQWPELTAVSPSAQFTHWIAHDPPLLPTWPFFASYGALLLASRWALNRRLRLSIRTVDATIHRMLAGETAAPA